MIVEINGERRDVADDATVADVVRLLGRDPARPGVAVAVEGRVVPRREWPGFILGESDRVEVVAAVQGG